MKSVREGNPAVERESQKRDYTMPRESVHAAQDLFYPGVAAQVSHELWFNPRASTLIPDPYHALIPILIRN